MRTRYVPTISGLLLLAVLPLSTGARAADDGHWPHRVLITNDDGINAAGIAALARAFAPIADTYVVAPVHNQSGTSNYARVMQTGRLNVTPREFEPGVRAWAVDGYPADCVIVGSLALMDGRPDLVISGINHGDNLGHDWIGSGTVGAARTAALGGVPAIAVSTVDEPDPETLSAASDWIVALARTELVRDMTPGRYLTVSIPAAPEVRGVRVTQRADLLSVPTFSRLTSVDSSTRQTWVVDGLRTRQTEIPADSDEILFKAGYIVVVPMQVDENDETSRRRLAADPGALPSWAARTGTD